MSAGGRGDGGRTTERVAAKHGPDTDGRAREAAAERLLARHGIGPARVEAVGHAEEIAAIAAPAASIGRLAEVAAEVKALGFEYVALELGAEAPGRSGPREPENGTSVSQRKGSR